MQTYQDESKKPAPASSDAVKRARRPVGQERSQWVKATRTGYYDLVRRREGAVFTIDPREYGTGWMVALTGPDGEEDPERSNQLTEAANAARAEAAALRLQRESQFAGTLIQRNPDELVKEHQEAAKKARSAAGIKERDEAEAGTDGRANNQGELRRGDFTHPDTGSAPSSGIGTNLNPAPYGQQKVDQAKGKSHRDKDVV